MENGIFMPKDKISDEVLAQAQLMMAREKFWTPSMEKLLRSWIKNLSLRQKGHKSREKRYYVYFYIFSIPNMLISAGLTSSIFATYSSTSPAFQIFLGILSMISTFIVSFLTLMKFSENAALHRSSADQYQELANHIILLTKLPKLQRGDPVVIIKEIMDRFNDIEKNSLDISSKYRKDPEYEVVGKSGSSTSSNKKKKIIKAPKASDIFDANDDADGTDKLTEILLSNLEEGVLEKEQLQKDVDDKNDYDTDEEDTKAVTLEIDPESLIPGETAPKSDYYSMMKDALKKTLNIDMNRYYNNGGEGNDVNLSKSPLLSPRNKSHYNLNKIVDSEKLRSNLDKSDSPRKTDSPRTRNTPEIGSMIKSPRPDKKSQLSPKKSKIIKNKSISSSNDQLKESNSSLINSIKEDTIQRDDE